MFIAIQGDHMSGNPDAFFIGVWRWQGGRVDDLLFVLLASSHPACFSLSTLLGFKACWGKLGMLQAVISSKGCLFWPAAWRQSFSTASPGDFAHGGVCLLTLIHCPVGGFSCEPHGRLHFERKDHYHLPLHMVVEAWATVPRH